jgi:hypothetical protein
LFDQQRSCRRLVRVAIRNDRATDRDEDETAMLPALSRGQCPQYSPLRQIAVDASQRQVVGIIVAAVLARNDVFNL